MAIAGKFALGGAEFYQPSVRYFNNGSLKYIIASTIVSLFSCFSYIKREISEFLYLWTRILFMANSILYINKG
jgi:hypothetical protein